MTILEDYSESTIARTILFRELHWDSTKMSLDSFSLLFSRIQHYEKTDYTNIV